MSGPKEESMKAFRQVLCILCGIILLCAGLYTYATEKSYAVQSTEPTFIQNGLQLTVGNLKGVKDIRTAYGKYSSFSDITKADTHRAFTVGGAIQGRDEYTIQYFEDGTVTVAVRYENGSIKFHICDIKAKSPVITRDGKRITFKALDGLYVIRYAKGVYTTSSQIKAAPGSRVLTGSDIVGDSVTVTLEAQIYSFCVQYHDGSCKYYVILGQYQKESTPVERGFSKHYGFTDENGEWIDSLNYWMYMPDKVSGNVPLILVLHSANVKAKDSLTSDENLDNMVRSAYDDIPKYIFEGGLGNIGAYIVMPQTNGLSRGWSKRSSELIALVDYMKREYSIDPDKVSVIGYSMGGTGAVELAYAYPDTFARVLAVAGGLDGVTNNTRPYIGSSRMSLDAYPALRVPSPSDISQYESETLKYLYDSANSRYMAQTRDEKAQAKAFRRDRTNSVAKCFNRNRVSLWAVMGGADVEVESAVLKGICSRMHVSLGRCDVYGGYSHSMLVKLCPELKEEIIRYLLNG